MPQPSELDPGSLPVVSGPRPEAQALRGAYLQLLKLCLCDLAGASTREVRWTGDKRVFSRTLTDEEQISNRMQGKDWPLDGLTMVGMNRLDDLQRCVERLVADGVEGDLIEAGAWRGGASMLIRATLDSLGARDRTLWVADSFQGFPAPDEDAPDADRELESDMSRIAFLAPALDTVKGYFARFGLAEAVNFLPGFFEETIDGLRGRRWSLIRLDADTYRATKLTLDALYPGLSARGYVIVDDYFHPYLPESCRKAVDDFRSERSIGEPIEQIDWNGARWRKAGEPEQLGETVTGPAEVRPREPVREVQEFRIPTDRELQLQDEAAILKDRLRALESQLVRPTRPALSRVIARAGRGFRRPDQPR
jgi:Macrocin-O-methyltransferase (TylF)